MCPAAAEAFGHGNQERFNCHIWVLACQWALSLPSLVSIALAAKWCRRCRRHELPQQQLQHRYRYCKPAFWLRSLLHFRPSLLRHLQTLTCYTYWKGGEKVLWGVDAQRSWGGDFSPILTSVLRAPSPSPPHPRTLHRHYSLLRQVHLRCGC